MSYDLVVMAGGKLDTQEWGESAPATKSLLLFHGKSLLELALWSFSSLENIDTRIVVSDEPEVALIARDFGARSIPTGTGLIGNLENALCELDSSQAKHVIVSTSDIPFLTKTAVEKLMQLFAQYEATNDFLYPVVPVELCEELAPGTRRTSIKTRNGRFTGGNIFLVNKTKLKSNIVFLRSLVENRKSPLKLASLIGLGTLFQLVTGCGTLDRYGELVSRRIDGTVKAIVTNTAEVAVDIDSPDEFAKMISLPIVS